MSNRTVNSSAEANISTEASGHWSLEEIRRCVSVRKEQGEHWEMPPHLAECPLCLEVFDVILSGEDQVPKAVIRRLIHHVHPPLQGSFWRSLILKAALFLCLLGSVFFWITWQQSQKPMLIAEGSVLFADTSRPVPVDVRIPPNRVLISTSQVLVRRADGSDLFIAPHSQFELPANAADATVVLKEGEIDFAVTHQSRMRRFRVRTPLGEIIVVGTKFRVTSRCEQVTIFKNESKAEIPSGETNRVATVRIHVTEGKVLVRNRYQEAAVPAGTTALLRENQPMIDLTRD